MARYELTSNLLTGNAVIDKEHRELIDAVNKLLDACSGGKGSEQLGYTVKFLNDYVDKHFTHEEQLQQQNGYPVFTAHKAFHDKYKQTLREITSGFSGTPSLADMTKLNGHISLLITHIKTEDKRLGEFLNKK